MVCLLLHSLAQRYAQVIERRRIHCGKDMKRIVMVGGGAQNVMLRRLTAERTGMQVLVGPAESSTVGNLAVQCAVLERRASSTPAEFAREVAHWAGRITESNLHHAP